jgi:predicted nucleotidyltransferase
MDQREIIDLAKRYLDFLREEKYPIAQAYLFGSYAKGTNRPESDIDIALIFYELKDEVEMQIQLMKLRRRFDLRIEPHPFKKKDLDENNPFLNEILHTGISI